MRRKEGVTDMKATRDDVARMAGVSTATVSYVINNKQKISAEVRQKVLQAIEVLGYKPDMIARSMATSQSMQLGIVLENISNPFFGDIVHGFENAANEKGYFVNICTGFNKLDDYLENFISRRLDGVFVTAVPMKFHMDKLYKLVDNGICVVMSGNVEADMKKVSSIESDYLDAMDMAVGHLCSLGHQYIAFLSGLSKKHEFDTRAKGYVLAMEKYGLGGADELLFDNVSPFGTDIMDGFKLASRMLSSTRSVTAVICMNDLMALGAISAIQQKGLRVPADISVMGFDGISFGEVWNPPLTTMSMQKMKFGKKAFELLHNNMVNGSTSFYSNKLQLVARQSTSKRE